jgi:hypothetical protein
VKPKRGLIEVTVTGAVLARARKAERDELADLLSTTPLRSRRLVRTDAVRYFGDLPFDEYSRARVAFKNMGALEG